MLQLLRAFVENVEKSRCNVVLRSPLVNVYTIEAKIGGGGGEPTSAELASQKTRLTRLRV